MSGNVQRENDCLELSKFVFDDKVDVTPECVDLNCASRVLSIRVVRLFLIFVSLL